ncbi:MAG: N-acetyltransferase [Candidatus Aenigmarchaeota archaeon]|nr:N-acetyltransferase [Candidatus Aenigmarchaeota archaeon]
MKGAFVHETATADKGSRIGSGTKVWHYAHVREGAILGSNCVVGHCAYVGEGVKVGSNVKIENKVSIFKGVTIEDDVFIGPHVAFTNDMRPRAHSAKWEVVKTLVKKGASIGVNSTIICGITIGSHSMVGGGSVVTADVPDHGLVYGNPAKLRGFVCFCGEVLGAGTKKGDAYVLKCKACGKDCRIPAKVYEVLK